MRSLVPTLSLLLIWAPALAAKWDRPFLDETGSPTPSSVEDKDKSWKEGATSLPPWPNDGDLIELSVDDPESRFRYYIDGKHLSTGADGAVRYILVAEFRSGVRNLSFEGLRCTPSGVFKIYAYGNNGRFEAIDGAWVSIQGRRHDKVHRDLHRHILCIPRGFEPRSKRDMIRAMRTRVPNRTSPGFLPD